MTENTPQINLDKAQLLCYTMYMSKLSVAIQLATTFHDDQLDKGKKLYILHPLRIMLEFEEEEEQIAAVLHDTVEDTSLTLEMIESLFNSEISKAVDALSRRSGETYMDFIRRCGEHKMARKIKLMDLKDNQSPNRKIDGIEINTRYIKATNYIVDLMKGEGNKMDLLFLSDKGLL